MKTTFTCLFFFCLSVFAFAQSPQIPIDFESGTIMYTWSDFGGGVGTVIDNPDMSGINTSAKVASVVKFAGETFGGTTLTPLDGLIDFGDDNAIKMKVWANRVDAPVLFKLEGPTPVEVSVNTTVASQWEELVFSFDGLTNAEYNGITIIYDNGTVGDGSADFTIYVDDIEFTTAMSNAPQIPIDFESTEINYTFNDFAGGVGSIIANPDMSGINTSANIAQVVKFEGEVFGGTTIPLAGAVDFGDNNAIKMKVWANRVDAPVLFKFESPVAPVEISMNTTVANQWEELTFSFVGLTGGVYTAITIIYDNGVVGDGSADFTLFFDDIEFTSVDGGVAIPINFEDPDLNYVWSDFAGGVATVIPNPDASGVNTSPTVTEMVKFAGEDFGGSTLSLGTPVDFSTFTSIDMDVWTNRVGAVLFKLESPQAPIELIQTSAGGSQWETLTYDFSALLNPAHTYTGITIIYDIGVIGDGSANFTMYLDNIIYTGTNNVVDINELGVSYFPNPVTDLMTIQAQEDIDAIRIFNISGQQVLYRELANNQETIDVSSLSAGSYFIKVYADDKVAAAKIIKQ